ncbi:unnamed protein product [Lupinus luteus]|uniref:Uncharacterized protein n=1 Tax=Lupinus luteus TaxID=3873 RepID=A0AAV1XH58_LUPLU
MSITNIIILISAVFLLVPPPLAATSSAPTAYELLEQYNFPGGILPKGITGYEIDESTGKFRAYLNGTCSFSLEEVVRDGDNLDFSVGIASASFPLDNFFVSPQCGCGLVCDDEFENPSLPLSSM